MLLTDEEIINYTVPPRHSITEYHTLLKAQLKKVVETLEPYKQNMGGRDTSPDMWIMISERDWQALLEEVK